MTTQGVKTQKTEAGNTKWQTLTTKKDSGNNFSNIMDISLGTKNNSINDMKQSSNSKQLERRNNYNTKDTNTTDDSSSKKTSASNEQDTVQDTPKDKDMKLADNSEKLSDETTDKTVTNNSELQQKTEEVATSIKNTIKSALNITDEELEKALETLGMTILDLLNPDNLKQFVLQINGIQDISALLTNETLVDTVQNAKQAIQDLKIEDTYQITSEELDAMMKQSNLQANESNLNDQNLLSSSNQITNGSQDTGSDNIPENHKEMVIEVQKQTDASAEHKDGLSDSTGQTKQNTEFQSQLDLFINNLVGVNHDITQSFTNQISSVRQMQDITNQIVEQIKITIKPDQSSMELHLNPESLGKINLTVIAKDGVLTAHFTAQNELVKEVIESQMQTLRENLNNQGLKVESIEVTVSSYGFDQGNQTSKGEEQKDNTQKNSRFRYDSEFDESNTEDKIVAADLILQNGNSIDYTA